MGRKKNWTFEELMRDDVRAKYVGKPRMVTECGHKDCPHPEHLLGRIEPGMLGTVMSYLKAPDDDREVTAEFPLLKSLGHRAASKLVLFRMSDPDFRIVRLADLPAE